MTAVLLAGNPNCGKSTLFNALTGARQRVGNWPGVTVERKVGRVQLAGESVDLIDLPGLYSLTDVGEAMDEKIARQHLAEHRDDLVINIVDASALSRGLGLTLELLEQGRRVVLALNMMDVAERRGWQIDSAALSERMGCPVVPLVASRSRGLSDLLGITAKLRQARRPRPRQPAADMTARYQEIDVLLAACAQWTAPRRSITEMLDRVLLNRWLAFPAFLAAIYLMFLFSINAGSAFIDFFDLAGAALFVEGPRQIFLAWGLPPWLIGFLADGVGGGVQLVGTFIPVIACLFLALTFLEDCGYMGRVAFVIDRLMSRLGLPGKSFVPLIVGLGCNVPAVMATRSLEREPDRILTTIMAPYMSCGARLTVYALFAAVFFPVGGQNLVFALYLIGIAIAVVSALIVRKYLIQESRGAFVMELPAYHLPTLKGLAIHTWQRLKGFVVRAGKAIVLVVICLNMVNTIGVDGSIGNQNTEKSMLSVFGKAVTPIFSPFGIDEDNWPATVGIFTGIFAKEVVVGTLDALYAPTADAADTEPGALLGQAVASVPANLAVLGDALANPLGIRLDEVTDVAAAAQMHEVAPGTLTAMQNSFHGSLGAFSYLLFILLYMPCAATIGVIYKEIGSFWAVFSTGWSFLMAYTAAVVCYQVGVFAASPATAAGWLLLVLSLAAAGFISLIVWGRRRQRRLIPVLQLS